MKPWRARLTREAAHRIAVIHPEVKKKLKDAIDELRRSPYMGKDLQEELSGFKSLRVGRYRIIYSLDEDGHTIDVFYAGPRKDIYEQIMQLVHRQKESSK